MISMMGEFAKIIHAPATMYSTVPTATSKLLLIKSDRLPAMGRQNREMKLIEPATTPISMPSRPSIPISGNDRLGKHVARHEKNVASMTNAMSRVMRRSCFVRGSSGWFDCCAVTSSTDSDAGIAGAVMLLRLRECNCSSLNEKRPSTYCGQPMEMALTM